MAKDDGLFRPHLFNLLPQLLVSLTVMAIEEEMFDQLVQDFGSVPRGRPTSRHLADPHRRPVARMRASGRRATARALAASRATAKAPVEIVPLRAYGGRSCRARVVIAGLVSPIEVPAKWSEMLIS